jgi:hypothetical protein
MAADEVLVIVTAGVSPADYNTAHLCTDGDAFVVTAPNEGLHSVQLHGQERESPHRAQREWSVFAGRRSGRQFPPGRSGNRLPGRALLRRSNRRGQRHGRRSRSGTESSRPHGSCRKHRDRRQLGRGSKDLTVAAKGRRHSASGDTARVAEFRIKETEDGIRSGREGTGRWRSHWRRTARGS